MKFRRRTYINDAKLQMKFVTAFIIICLLGSILTSAVFNYLALKKLETLMWSTHISIKTTDELLRPLFINITIINFILVTAFLIITGLWMIRKTTGPLYRMLKDVQKVAAGDLSTDITLRQKDELKDVAHELNAMVKGIRDRFVAINNKYTDVSLSVKGLKSDLSDKETSMKACKSLLNKIEGLETEINRFNL